MSLLRKKVILRYYYFFQKFLKNQRMSLMPENKIKKKWFMSSRFSIFMSLLVTKSYVLIASTPPLEIAEFFYSFLVNKGNFVYHSVKYIFDLLCLIPNTVFYRWKNNSVKLQIHGSNPSLCICKTSIEQMQPRNVTIRI